MTIARYMHLFICVIQHSGYFIRLTANYQQFRLKKENKLIKLQVTCFHFINTSVLYICCDTDIQQFQQMSFALGTRGDNIINAIIMKQHNFLPCQNILLETVFQIYGYCFTLTFTQHLHCKPTLSCMYSQIVIGSGFLRSL